MITSLFRQIFVKFTKTVLYIDVEASTATWQASLILRSLPILISPRVSCISIRETAAGSVANEHFSVVGIDRVSPLRREREGYIIT